MVQVNDVICVEGQDNKSSLAWNPRSVPNVPSRLLNAWTLLEWNPGTASLRDGRYEAKEELAMSGIPEGKALGVMVKDIVGPLTI